MIHPYTVGPMALTGFTWYQGEANTRPGEVATYACTFPAMIEAWRAAFGRPSAYFGFVQLSTWCGSPELIPQMRETQMAALRLPMVGYATNADHGAGCNIHPPPKQYCGRRLAASALDLVYGQKTARWRSPRFASQVMAASPVPTATVTLSDVSAAGLSTDTYPFNYAGLGGATCAELDAKSGRGTCAWAALRLSTGWVNATVRADGSNKLVLTAPAADAAAGAPLASSYGWGSIPMMNVYDADGPAYGLPALAWNETA